MAQRYGLDDDCTAVPFVDTPGVCNRCGKTLTGRQTQWCSDECSRSLSAEHDWTVARRAAKQRDRHRCVRCGQSPKVRRRVDRIDLSWRSSQFRLKNLGIEIVGIEIPIAIGDTREAARYVDVYEWTERLEVNHIEPRVGRGYGFGCHNHLSNLETLCHPCHVIETRRQAAERRGDTAQLDLLASGGA